jgi:hypothetical protein
MKENRYALAGWLAIASAATIGPEIITGALFDAKPEKFYFILPIHLILVSVEMGFGIYALLKFRSMLRDCFGFHKLDTIIILIIFGSMLITGISVASRLIPYPDMKIPFLVALMIVSIPMAVIGIVFGLRLLQLENSLHGLKKRIAYLYMAASICFATLIFVAIGLILSLIFTVMMGIVMIKGPVDEPEKIVEFV